MSLDDALQELTHPKVDVAFSPAHHQHGLVSVLSSSICCLVGPCLPSAGRRWSCVACEHRTANCKQQLQVARPDVSELNDIITLDSVLIMSLLQDMQ